MKISLQRRKLLSILLICALIWTAIGAVPSPSNADSSEAMPANLTLSAGSNVDPVPDNHLRIHYSRADSNYSSYSVWIWEDVAAPSTNWPDGATPFPSDNRDSYGAYVDIPLAANASKVGFLVVTTNGVNKDGGDKSVVLTSSLMNEVWIQEGSDQVFAYEPVQLPDHTVRIHYERDDQDYLSHALWLWGQVASPSEDWPNGATPFTADKIGRYGAYMDVPLQDNADEISFLIINPTTKVKDGNDKEFNLLQKYNQLWIKQGDDTVYVSPYGDVPVALSSAEIVAESTVLLNFTMTEGLDEERLKSAITIKDKKGDSIAIEAAAINHERSTVEITAAFDLDHTPLAVTYGGRSVYANTGWRMIDKLHHYDGDDLGAVYAAGNVTLKLWAPTAHTVTASVYDKNDATQRIGGVDLTLGDKGVWSAFITPADLGIGDLRGYFYQYEVTHADGVTKQVLDPYAKSMAQFRVNSERQTGPDGDAVGKAAIVDLSATNPAGFDFAQIQGYEKREDAIIWEAHIRDFTSDPAIAGDLQSRWGSYKAFIDKLDYIQSLGVTHVQLLPVMAWYYGDEAMMDVRELDYSAEDNEYNWGYDPHNYFSPDGAYSEDAEDPELRIKELKELIAAIHDAGMGVILDVVYTHMAKADFLEDIVPSYYFFQDANGNFLGDFENNLATNRKMAEKLMVDSVKYWFDEYKIDGMRWDMMGDATYASVQKAYDEAARINPNALFIGEGWRTFKGHLADPSLAGQGADQDWMNKTDSVGVFSDEIRNELKSGYGSEGEPRFITGGARSIQTILNNIKAQPSNTAADDPGDIVPYIEAHDNLPLYDVIAQSIKKDPAIAENDLEIHKRIRLGNLLVLTSQGTAFLHAGQEYGRTKQWHGAGVPEQKYHALEDEAGNVFGYFVHDSYDSSDAINMFDWDKATDGVQYPVNYTTSEYTKGLIELRKHTNAFRLGDMALVDSNVTLVEAPEMKSNDLIIGYKNIAMDGTGDYYVFVNADDTARTLTLPVDLTAGTVIVDNDEAGITAVSAQSGFQLTETAITLDPLTAVIIRLDAPAPTLESLELDKASLLLQVGGKHQLSVFKKYSNGSREKVTSQAVFSSDNSAVAMVTADGVISAIGLGKATITAASHGLTTTIEVEVAQSTKRYVQFNYIRPDGNYKDWNIWVWNTGVQDDQILFDSFENGVATAMIEVAADAVEVGFVLRKGTDWNTAKQDIGDDRIIPLAEGVLYTKVNVHSMVRELDLFPTIHGPYLQDGNITFRYRDEELFRSGTMGNLSAVKLKLGDEEYEMDYDTSKEWFSYTLTNVSERDYEYSFLVTEGGITNEVTDPTNTVNGKSIVAYRKPSVAFSSSIQPSAIHYNENAVLKLQADADQSAAFREGYMNLTALGGPAAVPFNTQLMEQSITVKDTVTAGTKQIPITLVDVYGNKHFHTSTVTVKARTAAGKQDFDWDEARIYFVLTDRFEDGDETNNVNVDKNHLEAYHGGDFQGLINRLDYLEELGINTLWITPIVDNIDFNKGADFGGKQYGYHGYWAKDFTQLDEHLGDLDTFKQLIEKAHDKGIKIMVDVVLNHTGYGLKPDDQIPGVTAEDKARFDGMLRTNGLSANVNPIKGELAGLPDFITEDEAVREQIIAWQTGWLEHARTERGDTIDYFRVDTVKHIETETWVAFKNALTAIDPEFKLLGEYYGGTIDGDGGMLQSGQMDSLLDFGFKGQARDFAGGSIDAVDAYLQDREAKLDNTTMMAQFLSSHDEDGFLSHFVDGDKGKLKVAAALQITAKGQPVIYYGEELGRSGANARDMGKGEFSENRADMPWERLEEEQQLHEHYKKLLNIRAKFSKLYAKGERTKLAGSNELAYLAFNKKYGNENVVTAINTAVEAKAVKLTVPFLAGTVATDEYSGKTYTVSADQQITLHLPGRDDGGTAIISGVSAKEVRPVYPISPGAPASPDWPNAQIIDAASLKGGSDGKATVALLSGNTAVLLPLDAASALGSDDLEITADDITILLPNKLLAALKEQAAESQVNGARIMLEVKPLSDEETGALVEELGSEQLALRAVSTLYELKLSIVSSDGTVTSVTKFEEAIGVIFKLHEAVDEVLSGVYYFGEDGQLTYVGGTLSGESEMAVELMHFSKYGVLEYARTFADVGQDHWALAAIQSLAAKGIVEGISYKLYAPDMKVTRAQFATMLVRALGTKLGDFTANAGADGAADDGTATTAEAVNTAVFSDVAAGEWYAESIATAYRLGIVKGRSGNRFAPNDTISREEMAVMIGRAYKVLHGSDDSGLSLLVEFADHDAISPWAVQSVEAVAKLGLVQGRGAGSFAPKGLMTRAEGAQVIYNLLRN